MERERKVANKEVGRKKEKMSVCVVFSKTRRSKEKKKRKEKRELYLGEFYKAA